MIKKSLEAALSIGILDLAVFYFLADYPVIMAILFFIIPFFIKLAKNTRVFSHEMNWIE